MQIQHVLQSFARSFYRYRIVVSASIIICTLLTLLISFLTPSIYEATAMIKVNTVAAISTNDVFSAQAATVDYALLVTSPDVMQEAARHLPAFTASQLQHMVSDSPVDNTQIISIVARAGTATVAANVANSVTSAFIKIQVAQETNRIQTVMNQVSQHIAQERQGISNDQQQLNALQNARASMTVIAQQRSVLDTDQANYNQLLASSAQLQIQKLQVGNILSTVQLAIPPDQPSSPQVVVNTLSALLLSTSLAVLLAFLLDWMDTTVRVSSDVSGLGLEALGELPASDVPEHLLPLTMANNGKHYPLKDAFTLLSTGVRVHLQKPRSILVTGLHSHTGTSITTANLAVQLAQLGVRVLLIDANIHRPTLHTLFRCTNTNGLSNLAMLEQFHPFNAQAMWLSQWQTVVPNLWLLPAGPVAALNTSPFPTNELQRLKASLFANGTGGVHSGGSAIDLILFDSAPLHENSTTIALTTVIDATILVIESGREQQSVVRAAKELLQQFEAPVEGIVLNHLPRQRSLKMNVDHITASTHSHHTREAVPAAETQSRQPGREALPPSLVPIKTITPASITKSVPASINLQSLPTGKHPTPSQPIHVEESTRQQWKPRLLLPSSQHTLSLSLPPSSLPETRPPLVEEQGFSQTRTNATPFTPKPLPAVAGSFDTPMIVPVETHSRQSANTETRSNSLNISRHRRHHEQLV